MPSVILRPAQPWGNVVQLGNKTYSLVLTRRRAGGGIDPLWQLAGSTPAVDFNFSSDSMLDQVSGQDLITYTRPSTAWGWNGSQFVEFANDVPRIVVDPATGLRGLLVEEARTNQWFHSANLSNAYWAKFAVTIDATADPGLGAGATPVKIAETATTGGHGVRPGYTVPSNTQMTLTAYVKAAERSRCQFSGGGFLAQGLVSVFDLADGTLVTNTGGAGSIRPLGNGWYACTVSFTTSNTVNYAIDIVNDSNAANYAGTPGSGILYWGSQLELGDFPTSPIITTGSALTRSADLALVTGANFPAAIVPLQFTLYADAYREFAVPSAQPARMVTLTTTGATNTDGAGLGYFTESQASYIVRSGSATVRQLFSVDNAGVRRRRIAGAGDASGHAVSINNAAVVTGADSAMPVSVAEIKIGLNGFNTGPLSGIIPRITIWPTRLPNATLQALTA